MLLLDAALLLFKLQLAGLQAVIFAFQLLNLRDIVCNFLSLLLGELGRVNIRMVYVFVREGLESVFQK